VYQCESLAQENEQLKERVEELSVDLQIIKEEIATAGACCCYLLISLFYYFESWLFNCVK